MRFFAADPKDGDRTGNLPPGTVVEKGVTHPYAFDFYRRSIATLTGILADGLVQAHAGLQGTAKPTH